MDILEQKISEYKGYIQTHISNVQKSFNRYGIALCAAISCDPLSVKAAIKDHDLSKYSDIEFEPYRRWFYSVDESEKDKKAYDEACIHHYKFNDHHPEYWIDIPKYDKGMDVPKNKIRRMPKTAIVHMLCDWQSFMFLGRGNAYDFYYKVDYNKFNRILHPDAIKDVEKALEVLKGTTM